MFNFFKKAQTFDPIERGGEAIRQASKLAQLMPFRYLLGNDTDGSVSFTQYTGVFVEQDKVHILNEEERAAVAGFLVDLRDKETKEKLTVRDTIEEYKTTLESSQRAIEELKRELYVTQRANDTAHRYAASLSDLLEVRDAALARYERQEQIASVLRDTANAETTHLTGTREEKSAQLMAMFDKANTERTETLNEVAP